MSSSPAPYIAAHVVRCCAGADAYTLQYGYAMLQQEGKRILFPPVTRVVEEKRNDSGRCVSFLGEYADGSRIRMIHRDGGTQLRACPPHLNPSRQAA